MWDGSRSGCQTDVDGAQECNDLCATGNWDDSWYVDVPCECDGDLLSHTEQCEGAHPYTSPDPEDADTDETPWHAPMPITWRYVIVIKCEADGNDCRETRELWWCGCDDGDPNANPPKPPHH